MWEMVRAMRKGRAREKGIAEVETMMNNQRHSNIIQSQGSILVIDTNCVHRGNYCGEHENESKSLKYRKLIQLSLIGDSEYSFYKKIHGRCYAYEKTHKFQREPQLSHQIKISKEPFFI